MPLFHRGTPRDETKVAASAAALGGLIVVSCAQDYDGGVRVWNVATGEQLISFNSVVTHEESCALLPDGSCALVLDSMEVAVLDLVTGEEAGRIGLPEAAIQCFALSPDGTRLLLGDNRGQVSLWDVTAGKLLGTVGTHGDEKTVWDCAISPDDSFLVSAGDDGTVKIWEPQSGELRHSLEYEGVMQCDAGLGAVAASDAGFGGVRIWDSTSGVEKLHVGGWGPFAVTRDGARLVVDTGVLHQRGTIVVWDFTTGAETRRLEYLPLEQYPLRYPGLEGGHEAFCCAVEPEGHVLVTGHGDGVLRIWDLDSGSVLHVIEAHADAIHACAVGRFAPAS